MEELDNKLRWRFDVNTFRLLGRELITDRITAVFELVKNCYDANSTEVDVMFFGVAPVDTKSKLNTNGNVSSIITKPLDGKVIIKDNGIGMSFEDIRDKWMVVGTNSKRVQLFSDEPFKRRFVGEKGIGRFAVDKLGAQVKIITKKAGDVSWLNVEINWEEYESKASQEQLILFTDIENKYYYTDASVDEQGTILEITKINDYWTKLDIDRLFKELAKVVSPFFASVNPFNIYLTCSDFPDYVKKKHVKADETKYSSHKATIDFDLNAGSQEQLVFDEKGGQINTEKIPIKSFGPVKMLLYYFNNEAKKRYNRAYKNDDSRIDGIKIYRNGIITTPFAEFEAHPDKKRDILGIDKRLWRDIFNKVSSREVIGIVEITKENNPQIIDATNRQDFVDTLEFRDLKVFIIQQLDVLAKLKQYERSKTKAQRQTALEKAGADIKSFKDVIENIESQNPVLKEYLEPLKEQAIQIGRTVSKGIQEQKKEREEFTRKENIYFSLMSLQDYAIRISHAVRTSLGKIKRMAEYFKDHFPDENLTDDFKEYSLLIYEEMNTLSRVIDFMLSYAASNADFVDFSVKELILNLLTVSYKQTFKDEGITLTIDIKDNFIVNANKKFFEDIIQNLVSNSIKALQKMPNKHIKCTGYIEDKQFVFFFSDNGVGIKRGEEDKVFEIYYTTTAEEGGAGLGLFIVKTRIEALKGTVEIVQPEFNPSGATIKITLPFREG